MSYIWQHAEWPVFKYDLQTLEDSLFRFAEQTGHITGILKALPENIKIEAIVDVMVAEAIKTSEIEGEFLSRRDVVSSIRNHLGLNTANEHVKDKRAQGAGELMTDVRRTYAEAMTETKLFEWHQMLLRDNKMINAGRWRIHEDPMQVVSGTLGKEKIHFEAPPSSKIPDEMKEFINWFNDTSPGGPKEIKKALIRSAIAHLYFETIHPFEDGNGRIGRAIAEKALSQTLGSPVLLSLSETIEKDKKAYYNALEHAQKNIEITAWLEYFAGIILKAQEHAIHLISFILQKSKFLDHFKDVLNERQLKVVQKMFDEGPNGFTGGMNAKKYMSITKASKATATRDLQQLKELNAFVLEGGGRSTRYNLNMG